MKVICLMLAILVITEAGVVPKTEQEISLSDGQTKTHEVRRLDIFSAPLPVAKSCIASSTCRESPRIAVGAQAKKLWNKVFGKRLLVNVHLMNEQIEKMEELWH